MEQAAKKQGRGNNQSTDTKFATLLVNDAIDFIRSGRAQNGVDTLNRALSMLPDIGLDRQDRLYDIRKDGFRGFE